ncbi:unnamed protein product [Sphagnum balticum]
MQQQRSTTINKPGSGRSLNPDVRKRLGKVAGLAGNTLRHGMAPPPASTNRRPVHRLPSSRFVPGHCRVASQPAPDRAGNLPSGP